MTRQDFLLYAMTINGIAAIVGFLSSTLIPLLWPGWATFAGENKNKVMLILNFAVPLGAAFALYGGGGDYLWMALVLGFQAAFTGYGANQTTYKLTPYQRG